jgi:hypothetical protein
MIHAEGPAGAVRLSSRSLTEVAGAPIGGDGRTRQNFGTPQQARRGHLPLIGALTHEALTILQMIGIDPAQAAEATVALAERMVARCKTLDQAAEELASFLLAIGRE